MELKKQKTNCPDGYTWTDYMSLPFTQNVSFHICTISYVPS